MPLYVWIALAVFLFGLVGGFCLAGVRGLETWRLFRRFRRRFDEGSAGMLGRLEALERRIEHASETAERLDRAMVDLKRTLAKAQVLVSAAGEAKDLVDRVRSVVPGR